MRESVMANLPNKKHRRRAFFNCIIPNLFICRATWTLLHCLAAQLPDQPSRQQRADTQKLIELLTRIYPCGECQSHFKDMVR